MARPTEHDACYGLSEPPPYAHAPQRRRMMGEGGFLQEEWMGLVLAFAFVGLTLLPVGATIFEGVNSAVASQDIKELADAISMFLTDTGEAPARMRDRSRCLYRTTDGTETACARVLFTGIESLQGSGYKRHEIPLLGPKLTGAGEKCGYNTPVSRLDQRNANAVPQKCDGTSPMPGWENIADHLVHNRRGYPGGWRGPYLSRNRLDPWGNSYLILVEPLWTQDQDALVGVVISAGPNGVIETDLTALTATVPSSNISAGGDDFVAVVKR